MGRVGNRALLQTRGVGVLACPIELLALENEGSAWRCPAGHAYDISRDGYVNLLPPGKPSRLKSGDDVESIHARRRFLDAGHYGVLARRLATLSRELAGGAGATVDVGCGEGYYTAGLSGDEVVGLDLSRAGIRLAARRHKGATFAIANALALPLVGAGVDQLVSVFAPVVPDEFARVSRPGAHLLIAVPAAQHLAAVRALLYETPQPHDEAMPLSDDGRFALVHLEQVVGEIEIATTDVLRDLITMTPYRFAVPPIAIERALRAPTPFTTPIEFAVGVFRRVSATLDGDGESAG
ncbi:MAG: rRNA (guanine745-N1)-methyltransferase [Actinomycetota bacterium]